MSSQNLKKGIVIIFITNIINLAFKLVLNFAMPKYLPVDAYADYKYFQLLVSYIGILHFGYIDGIYLRLGGKDIAKLNKHDMEVEYSALFTMQVFLTVLCLGISVAIKDKVAVLASISIIPIQITTYYRYVYQATGEFKKYGQILNLSTILTSVSILVLIISKVETSILYICAYLVSTLIVFLYLVYRTRIHYQFNIRKDHFANILYLYISSGIFIMMGNFATTLLTGMDRWFIKILMDTKAFAQYSFSVSIVSFLSIAISPFSITLYNYFCLNISEQSVKNMIDKIALLSVAIICSFFPAKFILEHFITDYYAASDSLAFLFAAQMVHILITCVYQNLYKAMKLQRMYSKRMLAMIVIGFISNSIMFIIYHAKEAFAMATFLTTVIWLGMCFLDFKEYRLKWKTIVFITLEIIVFLLSACLLNSIYGFVAYLISSITLAIAFMRSEFLSVAKMLLDLKIRR